VRPSVIAGSYVAKLFLSSSVPKDLNKEPIEADVAYQICNFTVLPKIVKVLILKSTPIVGILCCVKLLSAYLTSMLDLPTNDLFVSSRC